MHFRWLHVQFSSVQSLSRVRLFATPWIAARQASLSITNSRSSLKLMSIESLMPSSHLILCHPPLLLPPVPPSIRVFSNESTLRMRWPKYWSFSFSISPSKEHPGTPPQIKTVWAAFGHLTKCLLNTYCIHREKQNTTSASRSSLSRGGDNQVDRHIIGDAMEVPKGRYRIQLQERSGKVL